MTVEGYLGWEPDTVVVIPLDFFDQHSTQSLDCKATGPLKGGLVSDLSACEVRSWHALVDPFARVNVRPKKFWWTVCEYDGRGIHERR